MNVLEKTSSKLAFSALIILFTIGVDQWIKVFVKLNYCLGEMHPLFGNQTWAYLYFVENPGMALGMDFVGGTIILCAFRVVAICFLVFALIRICKNNYPLGFIICISLLIAGAIGNIVDNILYGQIFSGSSTSYTAELLPLGVRSGNFFSGKVVDMFYFPIIDTSLPDFLGGGRFVFFSPIFNFADACISCAVIALFLFYRKSLQRCLNATKKSNNQEFDDTKEN